MHYIVATVLLLLLPNQLHASAPMCADKTCPVGYWGAPSCSEICDCPSGHTCDAGTGACLAPRDCTDIMMCGAATEDGVYRIIPDPTGDPAGRDVYCDLTNLGGGWTLILNNDHEFSNSGWSRVEPGTATPSSLLGVDLVDTSKQILTNIPTSELMIETVAITWNEDPVPEITYTDRIHVFKLPASWDTFYSTHFGANGYMCGSINNPTNTSWPLQYPATPDPGPSSLKCLSGKVSSSQPRGSSIEFNDNSTTVGGDTQSNCYNQFGRVVFGDQCSSSSGQYKSYSCTVRSSSSSCVAGNSANQRNRMWVRRLPRSCRDIQNFGLGSTDGVYEIYTRSDHLHKTKVYCDMTTDGGGWTLVLNKKSEFPVEGWTRAYTTDGLSSLLDDGYPDYDSLTVLGGVPSNEVLLKMAVIYDTSADPVNPPYVETLTAKVPEDWQTFYNSVWTRWGRFCDYPPGSVSSWHDSPVTADIICRTGSSSPLRGASLLIPRERVEDPSVGDPANHQPYTCSTAYAILGDAGSAGNQTLASHIAVLYDRNDSSNTTLACPGNELNNGGYSLYNPPDSWSRLYVR